MAELRAICDEEVPDAERPSYVVRTEAGDTIDLTAFAAVIIAEVGRRARRRPTVFGR